MLSSMVDKAMDALSHTPAMSEWTRCVEALLVAAVRRLTSVQSGIFWTLSYVVLLAMMYLFHSPFRAQVNTRTDWYAQLTKGLQIWLGVVLLCFHVGPHLVAVQSEEVKSSSTSTMAQRMFVKDTVASIFFPTFCANSFFFLVLHKVKRRYKLAFTYGPSLTLVLINSVLLSSFATMHYTVCGELFSKVVPAVEASTSLSRRVRAATIAQASHVVCPRPVAESPFICLAFLVTICLVFIAADYAYKTYLGEGNPSRGILWAELYPAKPQLQKPIAGAPVDAVVSAPHAFRWWRALRDAEAHDDPSAKLQLRPSDPRLKESAPQRIYANHRHGRALERIRGPDGWRDSHDVLAAQADKYMLQPTNRPGMVPWFSTFIFNTTWQAIARLALDFLTFDIRLLQRRATPKVFSLHFSSRLAELPPLPPLPGPEETAALEGEDAEAAAEVGSTPAADGELKPRPDVDATPAQTPEETSRRESVGKSTTASKSSSPATKKAAKKKKKDSAASASTPPLSPPLPPAEPAVPSATAAPAPAEAEESESHPDIWFDWIADVGDGFNSTYSMARLLAQPFLKPRWSRPARVPTAVPRGSAMVDVTPAETRACEQSRPTLPRGSFVVIGGDLAYPTPDDETFTTRLFVPYRDALSDNTNLKGLYRAAQTHIVAPDPTDADVAHIHMLDAKTVSEMASGRSGLPRGKASTEVALRSLPLLFAIPGNHDWFDGLGTFVKYILEKSWIGGWLMPQKSSFFVLRLPYNWFMLCLDAGCEQDIDATQRNYFLDVIEKYMDVESCVILAVHEPGWIYDSMLQTEKLMQQEVSKIAEALGTRLRMQIAGDIHNYSRHVPSDAATEAPTLVVSGGGGAFMHGPRLTPVVSQRTAYRRACAFPAHNTLGNLLTRLLGFRVINWKFDLIIGVVCFMVVISLLPQSIGKTRGTSTRVLLTTLPDAAGVWWEQTCMYAVTVFSRGVTSMVATLLFFAAFTAAGAEKNAALWMRVLHASFWTSIVVFICCGMLAFLLCTLEYMVDNELLVSSSGHWGSAVEDQVRLTVDSLLNHTQYVLGGADKSQIAGHIHRLQVSMYGRAVLRWCGVVLRCLDPLEMLAYLSEKVSSPELGSFAADASRIDELLYYLYFVFFYWILVTPLVSFVIGSYLLSSMTFFDCLYDATYSAFQMEEFKNFVRFKIDATTRELHAYVVTMRHVPKVWGWDDAHQAELKGEAAKDAPPHLRAHPSRWNGRPHRVGKGQSRKTKERVSNEGNEDGAEILEHFVCSPHYLPGRT